MSPYAITRPRGIASTTSSTRCANAGGSGIAATAAALRGFGRPVNQPASDRLRRHVSAEHRPQPAGDRRRICHLQHQPAELGAWLAFDPKQAFGTTNSPETAIVAEPERADAQDAGHRDSGEVHADLGQPIAMLDDDAPHVIDRYADRSTKRDEYVEPAHSHDEIAADHVDIDRASAREHPPILGRRDAEFDPWLRYGPSERRK